MQIHVHTDHNIDGHEALATWVKGVIEESLVGASERITRVEVHLSDENSATKAGVDDMRCTLEAKLEGRPPLAVTEHASTIHDAVLAGSGKLSRLIDHTLDRAADRAKGRGQKAEVEVED